MPFAHTGATLSGTMHRTISPFPVATLAIVLLARTVDAASPVTLSTAEAQSVTQIVNVSGTVTSPNSSVLSPSIGGLVEKNNVDAGDRVAAGDVLVVLDRELVSLTLERAVAEETQAQIALDDSRRRLSEAEKVGPQRGIAESEIKSLRAEVTQDEAALKSASAAVREQQAILARHRVKAPFAGVVSQRIAEVGEWVSPGNGLVELVATDGLRFDFRVPQTYFSRISADTRIDITLDALPDEIIPGRVQAIVPVKDPGARTFLLRVVPETQEEGRFTPGMSARGAIRIDTGRTAVVVPRDALLLYPDGRKTVWVAETNGGDVIVREQRVATGVEFDGFVEIQSGLQAGLAVVSRGNEALRNGDVVIPQ